MDRRTLDSQFVRLNAAYRAGRRAAIAGKPREANPYLIQRHKASSHSEYGQWLRGWLSGQNPNNP